MIGIKDWNWELRIRIEDLKLHVAPSIFFGHSQLQDCGIIQGSDMRKCASRQAELAEDF